MDLRRSKDSKLHKFQNTDSNWQVSRHQPIDNYGPSNHRDHTGQFVHSDSMRSASQEEAHRIEMRHEELKRQIALKEQQLASLTGERQTVNILRKKLGLDQRDIMGISSSSFTAQAKQQPSRALMESSRRGLYASVSPEASSVSPSIGGFKSGTQMRNESYEHSVTQPRYSQQQRGADSDHSFNRLQFHPTRLPPTHPQRSSPLRSKSRSQGSFHEGTSQSPYQQHRSSSPNLNTRYNIRPQQPVIQEVVQESSEKHREEDEESQVLIQPQRIVTSHQMPDYRQSGQPQYANTYTLEPREKLYRERIEAMTLDNQSLQRRLNQVSSELEKICRENEDFLREMNLTEADIQRFNDLLNNKDDVDASNKILKKDLQRMKQANIGINDKLKSEEMENNNIAAQLQNVTVNKKNLQLESDNLHHNVNHKIKTYEQVSREKTMVLQKLHNVNNELERLNRDELQYNHDNIEMEAHVVKLQNERRELMATIERITYKYDEVVKNLSRDRRNMDLDIDWHTKLIISKNLHAALEMFIKTRKQVVFNEILTYCRFDSLCHVKLRNLSTVLYKLGHYKMKRGLNRWYDRALKPLKTREQNEDISIAIDCNRLQSKVFYALRQYQREKMDIYHFKTNAIERIWYRLCKDAKEEKKRAMDIWKQKLGFVNHTKNFLLRLLNKRNARHLEQALFALRAHSQKVEYHCRIRLLHKSFAKKMFLSQVWGQLRVTLKVEKMNRIRTLNSFYKAWLDYVSYNRHLMQSNMAAIAFRQANTQYTVRAVFQALRQHTESKKFGLLKHAVNTEINVAISDIKAFNADRQAKFKKANQLRACNVVKDRLCYQLNSFFRRWKRDTDHYRNTMQTTVTQKIIKQYVLLMRSYFTSWKKKSFDKVRSKKMQIVQDLQQQALDRTNESILEEKKIKAKMEANSTAKRKMVDKTFRKLYLRRQQYALNVWRDKVNLFNGKETEISLVIKKMRNRFLRQAFDKYLHFFRKSIQHSKNEKRADYIRETLRLKQCRKMYNALCYYTQWRLRVKRIWNKVLYRLDAFQKQRGIKRWNENAHLKFQNQLLLSQDSLTNQINDDNEALQQFQITDHSMKAVIKGQRGNLDRKAYRQIGNAFQRVYTTNTQQKFNLWKEKVREQRHKETIMKRSILHFNRYYLETAQRAFVKFLSDEKQKERLGQIQTTKIENQDIETKIKFESEKFSKLKDQQTKVIMETNCACKITEKKVLHTMECMERRANQWVYRSKKRMVFEMWRHVGKQEKAFLYCIKNVLTKSMFKNGFDHVRHFARNDEFTDKVHRALQRWSRKNGIFRQSNAFNKWKKYALTKVENKQSSIEQQLFTEKDAFRDFREKAVDQNMKRCADFFMDKNMRNLWRGWNNVKKHSLLVKAQTREFQKRQQDMQKAYALQKLSFRTLKTRQYSFNKANLIRSYQMKYLSSCFKAWKKMFLADKHFIIALSNLSNLLSTKICTDAYRTIKSYAVSKKLVTSQNKGLGSNSFKTTLQNLYIKKLRQGFQRYLFNVMTEFQPGGAKFKTLKTCFGKCMAERLRDAFHWWRKRQNLEALKEDLYNTGPVRAQEWVALKRIENLKDFMRHEHYTLDEVEKFTEDVFNQNEHLLNKYGKRWRIFSDNKNKLLLVKVMDRWKGFKQIRKSIRYQLNFCQNQVQNNKADMQRAFNKWKKSSDSLEQELWTLDLKSLEAIGLRTTKDLKECSEMIAENQAINNHLVLQRDEFLNYYIKGQILAMALIKDRQQFAQFQAASRWLLRKKKEDKNLRLREIRDAAYLKANLEERQLKLTSENDTFTRENEEMRQFKEDGEIIKLNMVRLQSECQEISDRIHSTDDDFEELKRQNELLEEAVREAEKKVDEMKAKGVQSRFIKEFKSLKNKPEVPQPVITEPDETPEQREKRLKLERLAKLSSGAQLR